MVVVEVHRVSTSCGDGVPLYEYSGERARSTGRAEAKGPEGLERYEARHDARSIHGLEGLRDA